jgi:hypothetical protein
MLVKLLCAGRKVEAKHITFNFDRNYDCVTKTMENVKWS